MKLSTEIEILKKYPNCCLNSCCGVLTKDDSYCYVFNKPRIRVSINDHFNRLLDCLHAFGKGKS